MAFFDPSVEFGLRFPTNQEKVLDGAPSSPSAAPEDISENMSDNNEPDAPEAEVPKTGEVVNLDTFRDK